MLKTAPPSIFVVALVGAVAATCVSLLPTYDAIDKSATIELLTTSTYLNKIELAYVRAAFASIIFVVQGILFFGEGWEENVT